MAVNSGMQARFVKGKPIMVDFDAGATTWNAGDVVVINSAPTVVHGKIPGFSGGQTRDAVAAEGGVYECMTDGTGRVGDECYWDDTNKKITATANGNTRFGVMVAGPTFLTSNTGPAADTDMAWVLHRPRGQAPGGVSTVAAAGAAIGNAAALNQGFNLVTGADGTKGVQLPALAGTLGVPVVVFNNTSNQTLKVYPPTLSTINELTANSNYNMVNYASAIFYPHNASAWYTVPKTAS